MSDAYNSSIDTELQVRLMNLVMGEASDFERDQLQLLMEQRAEVAAYYQHLEHLHGLLCEVGAGDPTINNDPTSPAEDWRLPADRRAQVLAVIDSQSPSQPDKVALATVSKPKRWPMSTAQIAVVALSACVLLALLLPAVQSARESARRVALLGRREMQIGLATVNDFQPQPSMDFMMDNPKSGLIEKDLVSGNQHDVQSTAPAKPDAGILEGEYTVEVAPVPGLATAKNLGAALGRALSDRQKDSSQQLNNSLGDEEATQQRAAAFQRMRESGMFGGGGGGGRSNFGSFARGGEASSPSSPAADSLAAGNDKPSSSEDFIAEKPGADGNAAVANASSGESLSIVVAGQTLPSPYYLNDDVQYFPAGENKPANETAAAKKATTESGNSTSRKNQFGIASVPEKPNVAWSDGGVENNLSSTVELPRSEVALGLNGVTSIEAGAKQLLRADNVDGEVPYTVAVPATNGVEQSYTVNVPSGDSGIIEDPKTGRMLLGGIIHTNESVDGKGSEGKAADATGPVVDNGRFNSNTWDRGDASAWMMTVTPHVVVPEEEEVRYDNDFKGYRQVPEPVAAQNATQSAGTSQGLSRGETDQKVASLVETYNDLMDKRSYAEAEAVAKQAYSIDPNSATSRVLNANARNSRRSVEFETDKVRKEEGFVDALTNVERAATPIDEQAILYPDAKTWEALSNRRKERYGDVSIPGKSAAETADFDSPESLIEKTVDPDSWQKAGGNNASNAYPATSSATTSAPAENGKYPPNLSIALSAPQNGEDLKSDFAHERLEPFKESTLDDDGVGSEFSNWISLAENDDPKHGSPKEQPADKNVLFGDVQAEFIEPIATVIVRGSKADVDRTLEVIDQVKGLPEADRAKQLKELSDSSGKDSKKFSVGEIPASEGVAKNLVNRGEGQVIDLREFENSERRTKASQIFETPADQTRQPIPKIDVRRPDEEELQESTVNANGATIPGLRQSGRELGGKEVPSPSPELAAKLAEAEARSAKLGKTLTETKQELSLMQAARRSSVVPNTEVTDGKSQASDKSLATGAVVDKRVDADGLASRRGSRLNSSGTNELSIRDHEQNTQDVGNKTPPRPTPMFSPPEDTVFTYDARVREPSPQVASSTRGRNTEKAADTKKKADTTEDRVARLKSMLGYSDNTKAEAIATELARVGASEETEKEMVEQIKLFDKTGDADPLKLPKNLLDTLRTRNAEIERARKAQVNKAALTEVSAKVEPFSTFSLHVSDVAFKLAQTALSQGQWPDAAKIRIEEFVNALDYHDPLPTGDQKVACRVEQAIHPFMMQRNLLRVSMRTAATGRAQNTPLRLTLLLDNSGSMERPDRRQAVLRAFQALTQQLTDKDQITLISFASTPRLLADKVPGNQGETLLQLVEGLPSEGGTNIEAALMLAREKAAEQQVAGAQNRIVLLTDGAVNLGNANPESLAKLVTAMRDAGIAFDAAGISAQDLNDEVLEALTRQGDGRYYLLDSAESIGEKFASQIAGALRPSAQNVKVQVEFNPQRVGRYKLLGFEKHRLNKEDFRNDKVDAAEMAAAEAGVAVYQYEIKPNGTGDVGSVSVRFRDVSTGKMIENRWPIPYESNSPNLDQAEPSMQLAASAAMLAAKLSGGPLGDSVDLTLLQKMLAKLPEECTSQPRVQQLRTMIEQAIGIAK